MIANSDEQILPFTSLPSSSLLMYSEILDKNKNDCSIPFSILSKEVIGKLTMVQFLKTYSEEIAKEILRCDKNSKSKKAVVVPLTFKNKAGGSHANALVFNTNQMTAEHFEPHGMKDYVPARKQSLQLEGVNLAGGINAINKELKKQSKEQGLDGLRGLKFGKGFKYIKPVDVCPSNSMYRNFIGVQGLDESKKDPVDFEGFKIKEQSGYCQLWTYFLLDLRLNTLDRPPQEVLKEYSTYRVNYRLSILSDPNKTIMGLIRGYSKIYFNMIRKLISEGKFTMEEFLTYRDILNVPKDKKKEADKIYDKVKQLISDEAFKKYENVMKNA